MSSKYENFETKSSIEQRNEEKRKARQIILDQAKKKYDRDMAKKEKASKLGEGTWMLDSVSKRIAKEEKDLDQPRKKKHKKEKKKKKKKKRSRSSSSGSSSEDEGEKWTEKTCNDKKAEQMSVKGPQLQRESWMEMPLDMMPLTSRKDVREAIDKEKRDAQGGVDKIDQMSQLGQHEKELNPHWKNGGTGLPEMDPSKSRDSFKPWLSVSGDGGLSSLRSTYKRFQQLATEEGRTLKDVVEEKWGSLNKLESMIQEAEKKQQRGGNNSADRDRATSNRWRDNSSTDRGRRDDRREASNRSYDKNRDRTSDKNNRYDTEDRMCRDSNKDNRSRSKNVFSKPQDSDDSDERRNKSDHRRNDFKQSSGSDDSDHKSLKSSQKRSKFQRPLGSDSGERRHEASSQRRKAFKRPSDSDSDDKNNKSSQRKNTFQRPESDERRHKSSSQKRSNFKRPSDSEDSDDKSYKPSRRKDKFKRPSSSDSDDNLSERRQRDCDDRRSSKYDRDNRSFKRPDDDRRSSDKHSERYRISEKGERGGQVSRWKKPQPSNTDSSKSTRDEDNKPIKILESKKKTKSSESSSNSSSDSDVADESVPVVEAPPTPPPKIMTEQELNDLAAKILRAEIMGDDSLVAELQAKLQAAREAIEASKSGDSVRPDFSCRQQTQPVPRDTRDTEQDDSVIVLTRRGKGDMVRPVIGDRENIPKAGKNRKKKNITTHDAKGERTQYFDDDHKFDLKTLVEQEKAGTAEDQNAMFSRLAARSNDRDLDVDDMFVDKAARKQNEEATFDKDRSAAIFEHKKVSTAMEKCHRCFDKVPKHLIVAIASKSYLCLPSHRSLADGHCFIVPMSHVSAATALDEDIWQEMQLFRKCLVQMFSAQDQDVVVMETVMHIKHFPHTALECVPLDREVGDLSPIYFKKAIQDVGPEWSDNKKLIDLSGKDVRHSIPKGFPYFAVDFGLQGGFATVIEDEQKFPSYFGREIVGGMIDAEPALWRKPHKENFESQRNKVLQFEKMWQPYDFTQDI